MRRARPGALRGLFSGGTLADEAMVVAGAVLGDIRSNIPLRPDLALPAGRAGHGRPDLTGLGHVVIDLGDDEFTLGRPHPMIDPTLRLDLLAEQAADPDVTVVLLDVVLGHAADPDPALRLAPAIRAAIATAAAAGRTLSVVVALCGTASDPQDRERAGGRAGRGRGAGVRVECRRRAGGGEPGSGCRAAGVRRQQSGRSRPSGPGADGGRSAELAPAAAARRRCPHRRPAARICWPVPSTVICAGIDLLADALRGQAVDVVTVDYRPTAFDTADAARVPAALQAVLADPRRAAANALAARADAGGAGAAGRRPAGQRGAGLAAR